MTDRLEPSGADASLLDGEQTVSAPSDPGVPSSSVPLEPTDSTSAALKDATTTTRDATEDHAEDKTDIAASQPQHTHEPLAADVPREDEPSATRPSLQAPAGQSKIDLDSTSTKDLAAVPPPSLSSDSKVAAGSSLKRPLSDTQDTASTPNTRPYDNPDSAVSKAAKNASDWNRLLGWVRHQRGPQWDYATGMYHVKKESHEYYAGVRKIEGASAIPTHTAAKSAFTTGGLPGTPLNGLGGEAGIYDSGRPRRSRAR